MKTQKTTKDIKEVVQEYFQSQNIEGEIAIACSGGIDSTCLLESILSFYPRDHVHCLHIDHGWREDSSEAVDFLKSKDLNLHLKSYKKGELKEDENSARKARYEFFEQTCKELNIKDLFTAHNLNDDTETILFRLVRGTSSQGLLGIPKARKLGREITVHRPLMEVKKSSIEEYCDRNKINYIHDSSNDESKFARNKIRLEILPKCEDINPRVFENISNLSEIISEEQEFLSAELKKHLEELGEMPWDLNEFRQLSRIIQRKALERSFTSNIRFCNEFLAAIEAGGFHKINFSKGKFFTIRQKKISLEEE